jgi:hypothetical protein
VKLAKRPLIYAVEEAIRRLEELGLLKAKGK